jgi:AcrR family transcriptional regulator
MTNKKRRRLSAEQRRHLIVQRAVELFSKQGFRATRVKDIAEHVGTSDALVFQHFPTKRELYDAILEEMQRRRHVPDVEAILYYAPTYDVGDVLTRWTAEVFAQTDTEPAWLRLILYASLERDEAAPELIEEHFQRIIDYVAYEIAEGQANGRFKAGDPGMYARSFFAGLLGLAVMRSIAADSGYQQRTPQETAATHVHLFLHGLEVARHP